jgi:purine-binding chemotaxis protein CheW
METNNVTSGGRGEYLAFTLAGEKYCIVVNRVREVIEYTKLTRLPNTLGYMKGLVNLRGAGIPVIDLRTKFGLPEAELTRLTSIIVMEVQDGEEKRLIGAMADSVQEVIELAEGEIEPAPRFGTKVSNNYIRGIGKGNNEFLIILDIDRIFSMEEITELTEKEPVAVG